MSLSVSIRMGLAKHAMSNESLAKILSVRVETVSSWRNGHSAPSYKRQLIIAQAFGASHSTFIKWGE